MMITRRKTRADFFRLHPDYFPKDTRNLLTTEEILRFGVVPLGFKSQYGLFGSSRRLNLGFIDPEKPGLAEEVIELIRKKSDQVSFRKTKIYQVAADQLISVLEKVYFLSKDDIRKMDSTLVDEEIRTFLDPSVDRRRKLQDVRK